MPELAGDASFARGAAVEVISDGALFPATITGKRPRGGNSFEVEYETLMEKASSKKKKRRALKEEVEASVVRPSPPPEREGFRGFELGDEVDAFHGDAWREGVVVWSAGDCSRFSVYLRDLNQRLEFEPSEMRVHREWVRGRWVPPLQDKNHVPASKGSKARKKGKLSEGTLVEIRSHEDGFRGAWFAATILEAVGKNKYLVQYKSLRTEVDKEFVKEEVDVQDVRPYPPAAIVVDGFNLNERVDTWYNDGWWEGVISKVLKQGRYKVYYKETDEDMVFEHSDLRPHQDWINGTWVVASDQPLKVKDLRCEDQRALVESVHDCLLTMALLASSVNFLEQPTC